MRGMNKMQASLCLLAITLCWSCEVVLFSVIPDGVNPFATTCVTSLIGVLLLGACFVRRIVAALRSDRGLIVRRIALLSVMNTAYNVLYLVGLDYFDVSTGAFTVSMTMVVLPVMLLAMRRGVSARTWASAACVLLGIVIAVHSNLSVPQLPGLLVTTVGCLIRAVFIVKLNDFAREHDPVALAAGMSGINAVITFLAWLVMQPTTFAALPWSKELVAVYVIYGYFIVAFTVVLNIFAQRRATAAQATVIFSTEIVFSVILATYLPPSIVDPVKLTLPVVIGCALVVVGSLIEILPIGAQEKGSPEESGDEVASHGEKDKEPAASAPSLSGPAFMSASLARKVATFAMLLVVFVAISLPFKVLSVIPGFTDIRPVYLLQPVYGIFFGVPGCIAFAVGNLIGDIASDGLRWSSIAGFVGNFLSPYLMYLFWTKLRKRPFDLRKGRTVALFAGTVVICAIIQALIITPAVAAFYPEVDIRLFATTVIANDSLIPIGLSIPFIILIQEELGFVPLGSSQTKPE